LNPTTTENKFSRWRLLGRVVLFVLGGALVLAVAAPLTKNIPGSWRNLVLGMVAASGAFALAVVFVRWEGIRLEDVGSAPSRRSVPRFVIGFFMGLLLVALSTLISAAFGHVRWVRAPETGFLGVPVVLVTYIALSSREELEFRGYPLLRLEKFFGVWGAQTIVAMGFAAEHMAGGWPLSRAILGAGVGSLLFGMAAIATRGLALPIGLHAAWNFGDWTLGGKDSPGVWRAVAEEGYQGRAQLVRTIAYLTVMGLGTLAFWIWHRRVNRIPSRV
jgi:membrane protease YdiL (CAAX protease family)